MRDENGVLIADEREEFPDFPQDLASDFRVMSQFGFKVVEVDGERMWAAATEDDYRNAEAKRLGIKPEEVDVSDSRGCYMTSPTSCYGKCFPRSLACLRIYNPTSKTYYCRCVK